MLKYLAALVAVGGLAAAAVILEPPLPSVVDVAEATLNSSVKIAHIVNGRELGHGSGVYVDDRIILTADHVCRNFEREPMTVVLPDGTETPGFILKRGDLPTGLDLCLVITPNASLPAIPVAATAARPGAWVMHVGNPWEIRSVVSVGNIGTFSDLRDGKFRQVIIAFASPGSSGGAVVNRRGELVGILVGGRVSRYGDPLGLVLTVPWEDIRAFVAR